MLCIVQRDFSSFPQLSSRLSSMSAIGSPVTWLHLSSDRLDRNWTGFNLALTLLSDYGIKVHSIWSLTNVTIDATRRPRDGPYHTGENLKTHSFISMFGSTVHINPSRSQSFSKTFFKPEVFVNAGFAFSCGRKTVWKGSFSKSMTSR